MFVMTRAGLHICIAGMILYLTRCPSLSLHNPQAHHHEVHSAAASSSAPPAAMVRLADRLGLGTASRSAWHWHGCLPKASARGLVCSGGFGCASTSNSNSKSKEYFTWRRALRSAVGLSSSHVSSDEHGPHGFLLLSVSFTRQEARGGPKPKLKPKRTSASRQAATRQAGTRIVVVVCTPAPVRAEEDQAGDDTAIHTYR